MAVYVSTVEEAPKDGQSESSVEKSTESEADLPSDESQLDIPGLKNVWDSKYTLIGKLIWMLIIVVCTIMVLVQVINRVQFYMSLPVSVSVHIENNRTMMYPDITLCNTKYFHEDRYLEVRKEVANITGLNVSNVTIDQMLQHMSIMDLWRRVSFSLKELVSSCNIEMKSCDDVGAWRPTISVMGICYTYSLQRPLNVSGKMYGMNIVLNSLNKTSSSWKILVLSPQDSPKAKMFNQGISISSNITMDVQVLLRQFRLKSTRTKSCMPTISAVDCDVNCLSDLTLKKFNCRLPFMEDVDAPYCSTPYHSIAESLVKQVLKGQEPGCVCMPACDSDFYETKVDSTYYPDRKPIIAQVRIFYENFKFSRIAEEFSYGFVPLLSDIGGTLGLFLGFSLLTIVEIVERLAIISKQSWQFKKQKKKLSQQNSTKNTSSNVKA